MYVCVCIGYVYMYGVFIFEITNFFPLGNKLSFFSPLIKEVLVLLWMVLQKRRLLFPKPQSRMVSPTASLR